jgi:hypothetical protein
LPSRGVGAKPEAGFIGDSDGKDRAPPFFAFAVLAAPRQRNGPSGRAGIKSSRTISARFGRVNRKMGKLRRGQAIGLVW